MYILENKPVPCSIKEDEIETLLFNKELEFPKYTKISKDKYICKNALLYYYHKKWLHSINQDVLKVWNLVNSQVFVDFNGIIYRLDMNVVISVIDRILDVKNKRVYAYILKAINILYDELIGKEMEKKVEKMKKESENNKGKLA